MSTAERKIFVTFCYYILFGVVVILALFEIGASNQEQVKVIFAQYLLCSESGNSNCQEYKDRIEASIKSELAMAAYILLGLFPAVNLFYVTDIKRLLLYMRSPRMRQLEGKLSRQTITTVVTHDL